MIFGLNLYAKFPPFPVKAVRLHDAVGTRWWELEPQRGQFNWTALDKFVTAAQVQKCEVLLPLFGTPAWASARPTEVGTSWFPKGSSAEPTTLSDWMAFVSAVATRYKGKIQQYSIWNEPNVPRFFTGTSMKLAEMVNTAYDAIKNVDSAAQIVTPDCVNADGVIYLDTLLPLINGFYDTVGFHFYGATLSDSLLRMDEVSALLAKYGVSKPLWNTEQGFGYGSGGPFRDMGLAEKERVTVYISNACRAKGIARWYFYRYDSDKQMTFDGDVDAEILMMGLMQQ